MESVSYSVEKSFHTIANAIAYGSHKIKPSAAQIEKDCKELIKLVKQLKEPE